MAREIARDEIEIDGLFFDAAYSPYYEEDAFAGVVVILTDISERVRVEQALTSSEEKFAKAFYASPDSITISDQETGKLLEANEGFELVFGYPREEAIGRTTIELGLYADPDGRARMIDLLKKEHRIRDMEMVGRRKSGELRTCLLSTESIIIAGKPSLVTVVRDITETREAELAVQLSEKRYRILAETMPSSFILLLDANLVCVLADGPELAKIGVEKWKTEGRYILETLDEEFVDTLDNIRSQLSPGETKVIDLTLRKMIYSVTLVSLDDARYDSGTTMILAQNVTERRRSEKARQEAEILRLELDQERELRELKSRFVSMIVHDFRNPVSVIQVSLNLLRNYYERLDQAKRNNRIDSMLEQTAQLNQLIDDVLMIGAMEAVTTELNLETSEIVLFCQDVFQEFIQSVDLNKFQVVFEDNNNLIETTFDMALMRRVLFNLLSNAVKYSPNGGEICLRVIEEKGGCLFPLRMKGSGFRKRSSAVFLKGSTGPAMSVRFKAPVSGWRSSSKLLKPIWERSFARVRSIRDRFLQSSFLSTAKSRSSKLAWKHQPGARI